MEKRISKYGGPENGRNTAISFLLSDEKALEKMVDYSASATSTEGDDQMIRAVIRAHIKGMLESARER